MKNKTPWAIALILLVFGIYQCDRRKQEAGIYNSNLKVERESVKFFRNSNNKLTASNGVLQLEKNYLKNEVVKKDAEISAMVKEFASIKSVIKIQDRIIVDSIEVPYEVPVPHIFERIGKLNNDWYAFSYKSNEKGFEIDSLVIPNETNIVTGTKRKWFFGAETLTTDVTNTNPYIKVQDIQSSEVIIKVPWYKKWYVWLAAGAVTGILLK